MKDSKGGICERLCCLDDEREAEIFRVRISSNDGIFSNRNRKIMLQLADQSGVATDLVDQV